MHTAGEQACSLRDWGVSKTVVVKEYRQTETERGRERERERGAPCGSGFLLLSNREAFTQYPLQGSLAWVSGCHMELQCIRAGW